MDLLPTRPKYNLEVIMDRITRLRKFADNTDKIRDPALISTLELMLGDLPEIRQKFEDWMSETINYLIKNPPKNPLDLTVYQAEFDEVLYVILGIQQGLFPSTKVPTNPTAAYNTCHQYIRLPEIKLKNFSGNIAEYTSFIQLFDRLTADPQISNLQRHIYLRSSLSDEPLKLISSLEITEANYVEARDILKRRYDDRRSLTSAHLASVVDVSPCYSNNISSVKHFLNTLSEHTRALSSMKYNITDWSPILIFLVQRKLDKRLLSRWEQYNLDHPNPNFDKFIDFLTDQLKILEATQGYPTTRVGFQVSPHKTNIPKIRGQSTSLVTNSKQHQITNKGVNCPLCSHPHYLRQCHTFLRYSVPCRLEYVNSNNLCLNCLKGHHTKDCTSRYSCGSCNRRHNTLLHETVSSQESLGSGSSSSHDPPSRYLSPKALGSGTTVTEPTFVGATSAPCKTTSSVSTVLLPTVQALVEGGDGVFHRVRVLLDSASEASFISQDCCRRLKLKRYPTNISVAGLSQVVLGSSKSTVNLNIQSVQLPSPHFQIKALVVGKVAISPSLYVKLGDWPHLADLTLADPTFGTPGPIDVLVGSEHVSQMLYSGRRLGTTHTPSGWETAFGWTLMGRAPSIQFPSHDLVKNSFHLSVDSCLNDTLRKFWEIENIPSALPSLTPEEQQCEDHYQCHLSRKDDGRYKVKLPFRNSCPSEDLRKTYILAEKRFLSLEQRLSRNYNLREAYNRIMEDYINQDHMSFVSNTPSKLNACYLPHHGVLKADQDFSKLRVVFDGSALTPSGTSLNNNLLIGPKLQANITNILIHSRLFLVLLMVDCRQMYRQILVAPEDRPYQSILWRSDSKKPLGIYQLNRVTFGVASAPYLAIRTLQQLVNDEGSRFPLASDVITNSSYVDDLVGGSDSIEGAICLRNELTNLLSKGGFELRKWICSHPSVLESINPEHRLRPETLVSFDDDFVCKVLGLQWSPSHDVFTYSIKLTGAPSTKRGILSEISRVYDPCGFLSPVIISIKILIKALWLLGLGWDDPVPRDMQSIWQDFQAELPTLSTLSLPRHIPVSSTSIIELHAFADSSEEGYAAAVYLRIVSNNGTGVYLIAGKTRVSPVKHVTIARLELCAALLASQLACNIRNILSNYNLDSTTIWTDSMVVLHWVRSSPHRWKVFVANRVSQIHELVDPSQFRYVPSADNPSDCASRGLTPQAFLTHPLWFAGPSWLAQSKDHWPPIPEAIKNLIKTSTLPETRIVTHLTKASQEKCHDEFLIMLLESFSSLSRLQRISALCFRYLHNLHFPRYRKTGFLSTEELILSLQRWVRIVQSHVFPDEIKLMQSGSSPSHSLRKLCPFLDDQGIIRVGGRLRHATVPYNMKHPILLPKAHHFTTLVLRHFHLLYFHPGPAALLALVREQFWILAGRSAARQFTLKCNKCFKVCPSFKYPIMGNLPPARIQEAKAFVETGVDYAGPVAVKSSGLRTSKVYKGYIVVFTCFTTKALHLELASDLSTPTFLGAFHRFIARRGRIRTMYSDCATNFQGAARQLYEWQRLVYSDAYNSEVSHNLSNQGVAWKFIPPSSPHFGGLWEAGVKAVKHRLMRTIGDHILKFEELYTALTQVEAALNSRPLCALSSDPADFGTLTPGHFLLQDPPFTLPEPDLTTEPLNRLQRWQLVRRISQSFWKHWRRDYLTSLQERTKWNTSPPNLDVGDLVILDDDSPPLKWPLGRIEKTHPGSDGVVRVVSVKTARGVYKRPVVKLCRLPTQ